MKMTPKGTPVGVEDPYAYVDKCDHLTGEGFCRLALQNSNVEETFQMELEGRRYNCPVVEDKWGWENCPYFRFRSMENRCSRCGLEEKINAHDSSRPLLERHHLSYRKAAMGKGRVSHEITVMLCRWCHAKVHKLGAIISENAAPDRKALELLWKRKNAEMKETKFESAKERYKNN